MRKAAPDVLATARAQRSDPAEVLRLLIAEEVTGRDAATWRLRRHSAKFPTGKTLGSWRAEDSTIPEPTQNSLITLERIGRAENLVIAGPSGTGKSHFTEGPGPGRDRKRPAGVLVHPGDAQRGHRQVEGRGVHRADRRPDLPRGPHRHR
ncbi:ATP-binding protein [Streptomyces sp. NBC_01373]|uniref:ATP-binding protein n=1 Tax=Streptomyces sp. NBC_01373 TaxID=2903843 RepID=UPI002B1D7DBC|nr:ATP-binding protein [Streptomyces sp. NBC_01373]